jgi:hypothetical protein
MQLAGDLACDLRLINADAAWLMYLRFEGDAGIPHGIPTIQDRRML